MRLGFNLSICCQVRDGVVGVARYLQSVGVYGSTPCLVPSYGIGEVVQAYCR